VTHSYYMKLMHLSISSCPTPILGEGQRICDKSRRSVKSPTPGATMFPGLSIVLFFFVCLFFRFYSWVVGAMGVKFLAQGNNYNSSRMPQPWNLSIIRQMPWQPATASHCCNIIGGINTCPHPWDSCTTFS